MNTNKKDDDNALPPLDDVIVNKLARAVAEKAEDMDEAEVAKFVRRYWYKMFVELEQYGKTDFFEIGSLTVNMDNPEGGYKFVRYTPEQIRMRRQLRLQQRFGGEVGDIGGLFRNQPLDVQLVPGFPVEDLLGHIAAYKDEPLDEVKQKFKDQLERAYLELVETGKEGRLPDFGVLRYTENGSLNEIEFDVTDEVYRMLEEMAGNDDQ